jgi:hypothetical protein
MWFVQPVHGSSKKSESIIRQLPTWILLHYRDIAKNANQASRCCGSCAGRYRVIAEKYESMIEID